MSRKGLAKYNVAIIIKAYLRVVGTLVKSYVAITFVQPALLTMKSNLSKQPATLPSNALAARRREVENALLVQALCGRQPSPAVKAQLRRYESGELPRELAFAGLYAGHK